MNEIELFDKNLIRGFLVGQDPNTEFRAILDIFTPLPPQDLSSIIDTEYEEKVTLAGEKTRDIKPGEGTGWYNDHYPKPLSPKREFLEGSEGPALEKGIKYSNCIVHEIVRTIVERDYELPHGDWAYTNVRTKLMRSEMFAIIPFKNIPPQLRNPDLHNRYGFKAESAIFSERFYLLMMDLYGNYETDALKAKMMGARPTVEQGEVQRDAIQKLLGLFRKQKIPFYITLANPYTRHVVLVNGEKPSADSILPAKINS